MVYTLYGTPYTNFIFQINFVLITDINPGEILYFYGISRNGTERKCVLPVPHGRRNENIRKTKFPAEIESRNFRENSILYSPGLSQGHLVTLLL
mgnify:CR=1 FL=1